MTSLVTPLIHNGRFVGVAGADIDLRVLQQQLVEMSAQLFGEQAHLHLLTAKGQIVASSQHTQHLSRPLADADATFAQALQERNGSTFEFANLLVADRPVHIERPILIGGSC